MAPPTGAVAGAVLTGGAGERMGAFKPLVELDGVPLAVRVLEALRDGGCERLIAVGGDRRLLGRLGVPVVADRWPGEGPLGGLITACDVAFRDDRTTSVVVAACDLGRLDIPTVAAMRDVDRGVDLAVARGARRHPSLVRVSRGAASAARVLFDGGVRAVHRAVERLGDPPYALRVTDLQVDEAVLQNFNTPADIEREG